MTQDLFPNTLPPVHPKIDRFRRYQAGLSVQDLYPHRDDGLCACGCGAALPPRRRRWASQDCESAALNRFWVIKGDISVIRGQLQERDGCRCAACGTVVRQRRGWEADHIIPVSRGGGGCELDNFQTLCLACHQAKTVAR